MDISESNTGAKLRYEREKQNISVSKIAHELHMPEQVILAIENDDYEYLPAEVYVRGYIRSYCRLLGIPESELLPDSLPQPVNPLVEDLFLNASERTHQLIRVWGSLIVISAIFILVGLWWIKQDKLTEDAQSPSEPEYAAPMQENVPDKTLISDEPLVVMPPVPTTVESVTDQANEPPHNAELAKLTVHTEDICWIQVVDAQGNDLIYREVPAGYHKTVSGYPPFDITLGKASVVKLWMNDNMYNLEQHTISNLDTLFFTLDAP